MKYKYFLFILLSLFTKNLSAESPAQYQIHLNHSFSTGDSIVADPLVIEAPNGDEVVVIGSLDHTIYFLSSDGTLRSSYQTQNTINSSPMLTKSGAIVVGSNDKSVYFFDTSGKFLRSVETIGSVVTSGAELSDGSLVFGLHNNVGINNSLAFVSQESGFVSYGQTQGWVYSNPLVIPSENGELIVFGSDDRSIYLFNTLGELQDRVAIESGSDFRSRVRASAKQLSNGTVVIGARDGKVRFLEVVPNLSKFARPVTYFQTEGWVESAPLILADDTVVVGSNDGRVYFLKLLEDGSIQSNSFNAGSGVAATPTLINDDTVVVANGTGEVIFLSLDAKETGRFQLPSNQRIKSSPKVLRDGSIVVGSTDGNVYFLNYNKPKKLELF